MKIIKWWFKILPIVQIYIILIIYLKIIMRAKYASKTVFLSLYELKYIKKKLYFF